MMKSFSLSPIVPLQLRSNLLSFLLRASVKAKDHDSTINVVSEEMMHASEKYLGVIPLLIYGQRHLLCQLFSESHSFS